MTDWTWLWTAPAERPHHPYSPSSLQNLEACPCYKGRDSKHTRTIAGTLAHKVVESVEDDLKLGDDDAVAAAECLDFVEERRRTLEFMTCPPSPSGPRMVCPVLELKEAYLPIDDCRFDDCESTTAGYVDHILLLLEHGHAEVIDWKFGFWQVEPADTNLQGIAYVLGVFKKFPTIQTVRFWFKQPHIGFLSDHVFHRAEIPALYLRVQTVVGRARVARKYGDFLLANPTIPVCNFCDHIGICPKVQALALRVAQKFMPLDFPSDITPSKLMDPYDTKLNMNLSSVLSVWAGAYRRQVTDRVLRGGADVPEGMFMQQMPGRRSIKNMEEFEKLARQHVPEEVWKSALDASFGPIEDYISEQAPRGTKEKSVKAFQETLEANDVVKRGDPYVILKVKSVRKKKDSDAAD